MHVIYYSSISQFIRHSQETNPQNCSFVHIDVNALQQNVHTSFRVLSHADKIVHISPE